MFMSSYLAFCVALCPGRGEDPSSPADLVARLGSPRYSEREAATNTLRQRGRDAIPFLVDARQNKDPEIRSRAVSVLARIETDLLLHPTEVQFPKEAKALKELIGDVAKQSKTHVVLDPVLPETLANSPVKLEATEALPFWSAIELLCKSANLRPRLLNELHTQDSPGQPTLQLFQATRPSRTPTSNSGLFRARIVDADYRRHRSFDDENEDVDDQQSNHTEDFQLQMVIMAEPRLKLAQCGPLRLVDAIDDRGRSLLPEPSNVKHDDQFLQEHGHEVEQYDLSSGPTLQTAISLNYPEEPGKRIRKLRGSLPVTVAQRKENPTSVSLKDGQGRKVIGDDVVLNILSLRSDPENEFQSSVELTLRPRSSADTPVPTTSGPLVGRPLGLDQIRLDFLEYRLEIVDENNRPYVLFIRDTSVQGEEIRITIVAAPTDGAAAPAQLRYYGLTRAVTEVSFDFQDIPMP